MQYLKTMIIKILFENETFHQTMRFVLRNYWTSGELWNEGKIGLEP